MKRMIKSTESVLASSMSRIVEHLESDNIATLTSFITGNDERREENKKSLTNNENKKRNKELSKDLKSFGYSFIQVDGAYKQVGQSDPVKETSYFIICPKGYSLDSFTKDMINLAKKYEQESVIVWSYEDKKARMYETTDFKIYNNSITFNDFGINKAQDIAWTQFKNNWFSFEDISECEDIYTCTNVYEDNNDEFEPTTPVRRISSKRYKEFGEWY